MQWKMARSLNVHILLAVNVICRGCMQELRYGLNSFSENVSMYPASPQTYLL